MAVGGAFNAPAAASEVDGCSKDDAFPCEPVTSADVDIGGEKDARPPKPAASSVVVCGITEDMHL